MLSYVMRYCSKYVPDLPKNAWRVPISTVCPVGLLSYVRLTYLLSSLLLTYLLTYLFTYLFTYLLTYLFTYLLIYLLIYLLTPWSRVHLEKLTGTQLVKKFPEFYGTRKFFTAFTSARQLFLSWARLIQPMLSHLTFWRFILILSSHLRLGLPSGLFKVSAPKPCIHLCSIVYAYV